jgi:hypothetical protein
MPRSNAPALPPIRLLPGVELRLPFPDGMTLYVTTGEEQSYPDWSSLSLAILQAMMGRESPLRVSWTAEAPRVGEAQATPPGGSQLQGAPSQRRPHPFLTHPTYTGPGCAICARPPEEH